MGLHANVMETELGLERRCTRCGDYWPEDREFWFIGNRKDQKKPCIQQPCKACYVELPSRKSRKAAQKGVRKDEVINRCHRLFLSGFPARGRARLHPGLAGC